jgi:hypothetical protein
MNQERAMKTAAAATFPGVLFALGLAAGCAGGGASTDGDDSNWESGDDASTDANVAMDVSTSVEAGVDSPVSIDAGTGEDSTTSMDADAVDDADLSDVTDAPTIVDAPPTVSFGTTCPTGTTYNEPFSSDPVASGTFIPLIGSYTYNTGSNTLSVTGGNPNAQLWIGARDSWTNYTLTAQVRIDSIDGSGGNGGITFRMESTPSSPANNAGQMYYAGISLNQAILGIENGNWTEFTGPSATFVTGTFYTLQVVANGSSLSMSVNGTSYATNVADATYSVGSFGLRAFSSSVTYGAITVTCN